MKKVIWVFLALALSLFAETEGISPRQFKIEMAKNCEVMMLREKPERKAKKIFTSASTGDCVENMGCIRNITQKELDSIDEKKRHYLAWQNPVWCKVAYGKKQGWIEQQFLQNVPCEEDE
jgi:hypothetical protein